MNKKNIPDLIVQVFNVALPQIKLKTSNGKKVI
jgi:hypothetical protein